ncbi:MAG: hypothetical protein WC005_01125 [Candidatus Nanopelagicales bacterium]
MQLSTVCQVCGILWDEAGQYAINCPVCGTPNPSFVVHDDFCPKLQSDEAGCLCELLKAVRTDERRVGAQKIQGLREQMSELYARHPKSRDHEQAKAQMRGMYAAEMLMKGPWLRRRR